MALCLTAWCHLPASSAGWSSTYMPWSRHSPAHFSQSLANAREGLLIGNWSSSPEGLDEGRRLKLQARGSNVQSLRPEAWLGPENHSQNPGQQYSEQHQFKHRDDDKYRQSDPRPSRVSQGCPWLFQSKEYPAKNSSLGWPPSKTVT